MSDDVRIDFSYDRKRFQDLKEFVDAMCKSASRNAKAYYAERIFDLAYRKMEETEEEREKKAMDFAKIKREMREAMNESQ